MIKIPIDIIAFGKSVRFELSLDPDLRHDNWIISQYNNKICYETEAALVMLRALREGDVVLDIGANLGFFSCLMSKLVGDSGMVVACEALPETAARLRGHLDANKCSNAIVVERPIWSREEDVTFHINSDDVSSSALWDAGLWWENNLTRANPRLIQAHAATLDSLDIPFSKVRFVKMDTEGAEHHIMLGASKLLEQHPPFILAELNPFGLQQLGTSDVEFIKFMRSREYSLFFIHGDDHLPTFVPETVVVRYVNDCVVKNVLFSTLKDIVEIWPEAVE